MNEYIEFPADGIRNFLKSWNVLCINPVGNTIISSPFSDYQMDIIKHYLKDFMTEDNKYYIIKYQGNTIKIEK